LPSEIDLRVLEELLLFLHGKAVFYCPDLSQLGWVRAARAQRRMRHVCRRNGLDMYHMFLHTPTKTRIICRSLQDKNTRKLLGLPALYSLFFFFALVAQVPMLISYLTARTI